MSLRFTTRLRGPRAIWPHFSNVIDTALADVPSGRLHKRLVEAGKAKSIFSINFGLAEPGYMLVGANQRPSDDLAAAHKILLDTV